MDLKQKVSDVVEKVEEAIGIKPEEVVAEPKVKEAESVPVVEKTEDRSAYNCPDCGGEGLRKLADGNLVDCRNCNNTGKV